MPFPSPSPDRRAHTDRYPCRCVVILILVVRINTGIYESRVSLCPVGAKRGTRTAQDLGLSTDVSAFDPDPGSLSPGLGIFDATLQENLGLT